MFGSQITLLALPLAAVLTLHAGSFQMGVLSAAGMLPWLCFALPAGVWTDRRPRRRRILIATDLGRAAILLTVPIASALDVLAFWQLVVVAFCAGTLTLFFNLAWVSYLPTIVPREQLVDANSKLMTSASAAQIAGPSFAGALVGIATAPFAILVDAVSFVVSAVFIVRIEAPEEPRPVETARPWRHDLALGLRFVAGDGLQRAIAGQRGDAELLRRGAARDRRALRLDRARAEPGPDRARVRGGRRRRADRRRARAAGQHQARRRAGDPLGDRLLPGRARDPAARGARPAAPRLGGDRRDVPSSSAGSA